MYNRNDRSPTGRPLRQRRDEADGARALPVMRWVLAVGILTPIVAFSLAGAYAIVKSVDRQVDATRPRAAPATGEAGDSTFPEADAEPYAETAEATPCIMETDIGACIGALVKCDDGLRLYAREQAVHSARTVSASLGNGQPAKLGEFEVSSNRDLVGFKVVVQDGPVGPGRMRGKAEDDSACAEAERIARLADGADWIKIDFREYSRQSCLFTDICTMLAEIDALYKKLDEGTVLLARASDAAAQYRCWKEFSEAVAHAYAGVREAKAKVDELARIDGDYARLKFDQIDGYLRLQNWKMETEGWIDRRVNCTKSELRSLLSGGVDSVAAVLRNARQLMDESELRIPSFRRKAEELAGIIDRKISEDVESLRYRCEKRSEDIVRYEQSARDAVEDSYRHMLDGASADLAKAQEPFSLKRLSAKISRLASGVRPRSARPLRESAE